mmetsp:Transcript_54122/g.112399  ORF Transcript_54122/g.112399 Transcript_54122/m.112399 type:complete len:81 (+) Transcript_54122:728-970(+)
MPDKYPPHDSPDPKYGQENAGRPGAVQSSARRALPEQLKSFHSLPSSLELGLGKAFVICYAKGTTAAAPLPGLGMEVEEQ